MKKLIDILVVEDDPADADSLAQFLRRSSFCNRVAFAATQEEAKAKLKAEPFDMVLLDTSIGFDFARWLHQNHTNVIIVCVSAAADIRTISTAREAHCAGFIIKPVTMSGLEKLVQSIQPVYFGILREIEEMSA